MLNPLEEVKYALTFKNKTVEADGKVWERTRGKSQIKRENEISDSLVKPSHILQCLQEQRQIKEYKITQLN